MDLMKETVSTGLGIPIDYTVQVNLNGFVQLVDAIGGVEFDVPINMDYDDPYQGLSIHLSSGAQNLSGEEALGFLRYRSGYASGDIGRLDAQKLFLNALVDKLVKMKDVSAYFTLFKTVRSLCETNIKEQDIITIGLKCSKNKEGKAYYVTAPGEAVRAEESGAWYYILTREATSELLGSRFASANDKKDFDNANKFVDKRVKSFYDIYNKRCHIRYIPLMILRIMTLE
jgi:anionic cell wall polymer biosynthesis LytR-Cps2A-Psr (LCP) family protein